MIPRTLRRSLLPLLLLALLLRPASAAAQPVEAATAFSLSSSEVFTSRGEPSFYLTFRHLSRLDFRVYRVRDAAAFFAGLRDPHQMGSEEQPIPTERSWIERLADWKRERRSQMRGFVRRQVTPAYRAIRRAASDRSQVAQRVALNQTTFAQVPLLNPDQLVTSWRELLPDHRDAEMRRIPLAVRDPGIYVVEAVADTLRAYTIVIVSDAGLVVKAAPGQMLVFAAHRVTGEPLDGCAVRVLADRQEVAQGTTNADGMFETALTAVAADDLLTLAQCGDQVAVSDPGGWSLRGDTRQLVGYIYTDKPIYRPGHTVHVKGILRWRERDALHPLDRRSVELTATDVDAKVVYRATLDVDEFGAIHASFPVPAAAALGSYTLRIASGDQQALGSFEVQEYRRPEFEVIASPEARFVRQGQLAAVSVQARYYFGQPVANANVRFVVSRQSYFSPLRSDEGGGEEESGGYYYGGDQIAEGTLRLDGQGRGEISVPTTADESGRDYSLRVEAQVTDASSRVVSGDTVVHATYGSFLLVTRLDNYVFRPGQQVTTTLRAVDYTGAPRPLLPVTVVVERLTYATGYYAAPTVTRVSQSSVTLDTGGLGETTITLGDEPGEYRVRATTQDAGRAISDDSFAWVPGAQAGEVSEGDRYLELIADRRTYAPGDTARLIVRGEPVTGPVLVTKEGQSVTWHRLVRVTAGAALEVPIAPGDAGDIYVNLAYMRDGRLYRADRRLTVPATDRTLQVAITADKAVAKPQEPGTFTVSVRNAAGAPVRAQVSLGVIDEAVYAIKTDQTSDPVRFFYRREYSAVSTTFSRDYHFTGYSGRDRLQLAGRRRRPFSLADFKGEPAAQPQVRKDFPDAIYWMGDLVTDANGDARVAVKYPDALTTWRLTARAVTGDTLAGASVARTTTTKDLIVRVITPRFLTEGDEVVLPTIVHNYVAESKDTTIAIAATGLQPAAGVTTAPITAAIAEGGERRDDWRFTAPAVGAATVTGSARTATDSDAVELPLPVLPYGLRREAGTSGSFAGGGEASATVTVPEAANASGRVVRVSLAPSMAGSMLGALDFLTGYPYGCTEQTLSSFLPNLVVNRALAQLGLPRTEALSTLDRQVSAGMRRLLDYQHDDGGWGWWKADENHPFMTAYAMYGLSEARREGYAIHPDRFEAGLQALAAMQAANPRAQPDLKAYLVFVLGRAAADRQEVPYRTAEGQAGAFRRGEALDDLWSARDRMTAYGRALLLLALDDASDGRGDELAVLLMGEVRTQGDLSFWASDRDPLLFDLVDTSVEATATALRALAHRDPRNPVLDRAVRWLMVNRRGGYWISTKQTAMALYGLLDLLRARNETPQTFAADVYVNGTLAATQTFAPASLTQPDPVVITVPARPGANAVRIVTRGGGTVYWSATSVYFDAQAATARSGSRQLAVARRYARLTPARQRDGTILYREEPLQGAVRPGDVLTVRLTAAGSDDWRYLMLEDPLPAGVEAVQDTTAYPLERPVEWWYGSGVEYRDNRTVFFQQSFVNGRYEFVYLVKAISSGQFRVVPAQIAPMYVPDVAASSEPFTLTVALPEDAAR